MKKKIATLTLGLLAVLTAKAQYVPDVPPFAQDKIYVSASASGAGLSYYKGSEWKLDIQAKAGYLFIDDWMITGTAGYTTETDVPDVVKLGVGLRYYFESCGIYVGASGNYFHSDGLKDFRPEVNVRLSATFRLIRSHGSCAV